MWQSLERRGGRCYEWVGIFIVKNISHVNISNEIVVNLEVSIFVMYLGWGARVVLHCSCHYYDIFVGVAILDPEVRLWYVEARTNIYSIS